ncbi:MAG: hypothetical protein WEC75_14580 [Dehalococcoidia bacterium]
MQPGTIENKALLLDLVGWVAVKPRTYAEVMEAWRTSCPRLPIWEDATDLGFVRCERQAGRGAMVRVTQAGETFLHSERRRPSS